MVQVGNYIAQDGWVNWRDNPHDRTEATKLAEDISSESRTSIAVEPMPYDLPDGHELVIQKGDPSNPPLLPTPNTYAPDQMYNGATYAYVAGGVTQGDTTIPIDDGNGNPVTVTASTGDRILSDFQSLWPIHARETIRTKLGEFMAGFVDEGGKLDGITLDTELSIDATKGVKHDPRWGDDSEGIGGVSFKERLAPYTIDEVIGGNNQARSKWRKHVSNVIKRHHLNDAVFEEIKNEYPDIFATDWNNSGISEASAFPQMDGRPTWDVKTFGSHGNHEMYATIRNLSGKALDDGRYKYGSTAFATTRWQVSFMRALHRENDGKVQPWISYEDLNDALFFVTLEGTPHYEEFLRHVSLTTDPDVPLLYFNARSLDPPGTDEADLRLNRVMGEVNEQLDGNSFTLHTTENIDWESRLIVSAVDTPTKRLWRVTVRRVDPNDDRPITVNVSNGDQFTVPGGEVGAWYESGLNKDLTFSYTHPSVNNEYPSEDWQGLGTGTWTGANEATTITRNEPDPNGGNRAIHVDQACCDMSLGLLTSPDVPVEPNTKYVFSFWFFGGQEVRINESGSNDRLARSRVNTPFYQGNWGRHRMRFETNENTTALTVNFKGSFPSFQVAQPMLNKGEEMGPYESPDKQVTSAQSVNLRKGWNLVSTFIQPSTPDLDTVLSDAISEITRMKNESGQVFDPESGLDEIDTWDPGKAYSIHVEAPTSFTVEGTALGSAEVSLQKGWNWLPYLDSTSVAIGQGLESIQNDLTMVKNEGGKVYLPGKNTTQVEALEPGAAYKVYVEKPVVINFPLR